MGIEFARSEAVASAERDVAELAFHLVQDGDSTWEPTTARSDVYDR